MRPRDFDVTLYDAGVHTLINSVARPLVALQDGDALQALTGYVQVYLAQSGSLGTVASTEAIQVFILHAQRVGAISVSFLTSNFMSGVTAAVPSAPPEAPAAVYLTDAGSGVVNASAALGENSDRYELQRRVEDVWTKVATGTIRADGVDFQDTPGTGAGSCAYRVVARYGDFVSFPSAAATVTVA